MRAQSTFHLFVVLKIVILRPLRAQFSIAVLGKVIRALGQHAAHVPYRDSTLTMLLRSSFGGRSKTAVVINAACEGQHLEETVCSLQFGQRVALVKTDATVVVGNDEVRCHIDHASAPARNVGYGTYSPNLPRG